MTRLATQLDRNIDELLELFGHSGELLAQLWQSNLRHYWAEFPGLAQRIFDGELIDEIRVNLPLRRAALHLIVFTHRYDE